MKAAHPYALIRGYYRAQTQLINKSVVKELKSRPISDEIEDPWKKYRKASIPELKPSLVLEQEGKPLDKWRFQHLVAYLFEFRYYHQAFTHMKRLYVNMAGPRSVVPEKVMKSHRRAGIGRTISSQQNPNLKIERLEQKYAQMALEKIRRLKRKKKLRG